MNDFKCRNKSWKVTRYLDFITFDTEDAERDLEPPENGNEKWFLYFYNFERKKKKNIILKKKTIIISRFV